ncbi:MAG: hypothetical protein HPY71_03940 [Firmicutes bacterium]|nr:hypothetical protein [Bacillota bacterium]
MKSRTDRQIASFELLTCDMHYDMMHMVMHMKDANNNSPKAITVRIPGDEYERLRKYAAARNVSLNSVVAEAIAQYGTKLERHQAISRIQTFQMQLRDGRKEGSDSVDSLRRIRETRSKRGDKP